MQGSHCVLQCVDLGLRRGQARFQVGPSRRGRLARLGYHDDLPAALLKWAGIETLEERVDGAEAIDPVVLTALREVSP